MPDSMRATLRAERLTDAYGPEMAREMLGLQGMTEQLVVALLQRPILTPVEV